MAKLFFALLFCSPKFRVRTKKVSLLNLIVCFVESCSQKWRLLFSSISDDSCSSTSSHIREMVNGEWKFLLKKVSKQVLLFKEILSLFQKYVYSQSLCNLLGSDAARCLVPSSPTYLTLVFNLSLSSWAHHKRHSATYISRSLEAIFVMMKS